MTNLMKKVNDRGEVAILVSPGYGAGWYSWNTDYPQLLFDPEIVDFVLECEKNDVSYIDKEKQIINKFQSKYPNAYLGGADGLKVKWIKQGTQFKIKEYDGSERVEYCYDVIKSITA